MLAAELPLQGAGGLSGLTILKLYHEKIFTHRHNF